MGQRYNAMTPRLKDHRDPKKGSWWHKVGSAWENDDGLVTVFLDSLPIPDHEGKIKIMLFEPKEDDDRPQRGRRDEEDSRPRGKRRQERPLAEELDDEIPF